MTNLETGTPIRFCWKTCAVRLAAAAVSVASLALIVSRAL